MKAEHSKKTIAVTDAFGLMGPAIIRELLAANYSVRTLVHPNADLPTAWQEHPQLKIIRGEVLDPVVLDQFLQEIHLVVHTAHFFSFQSKHKIKMRRLHIEGTRQLINMALNGSVEKLIHLSSTEALGHGDQTDGDGPRMKWDEDSPHSLYGRSLFHSELEAWRGQAEGLSIVILRPSYILGASPVSNPIGDWLEKVARGLPFFPTGSAGWVHAIDVARAVRGSLDPEISNRAWVLNAGNLSYKAIMDQLAATCGTRPPLKPWWGSLSPFMLSWNQIQSWWDADALWLGKDSLRLSRMSSLYDGSAAARGLKFNYQSLEESIMDVTRNIQRKDRFVQPQLLLHQ